MKLTPVRAQHLLLRIRPEATLQVLTVSMQLNIQNFRCSTRRALQYDNQWFH